jgi:hypothetical protein
VALSSFAAKNMGHKLTYLIFAINKQWHMAGFKI